jgi:hypothetical protein
MYRIGQSAKAPRIALSGLSDIAEKNKNSTPPHFKKQLETHTIFRKCWLLLRGRARNPGAS